MTDLLYLVALLCHESQFLTIAIPPKDMITRIHVESILDRRNIDYTVETDLGFEVIRLTREEPGLNKTLDKEAPRKEFSFVVEGYRALRPEAVVRNWSTLSSDQISGRVNSPIQLRRILAVESLSKKLIRGGKYLVRSYLGSDLRYHLGFDVSLSTVKGERRYQIFTQNGRQLIMPLQSGDGGIKVLAE